MRVSVLTDTDHLIISEEKAKLFFLTNPAEPFSFKVPGSFPLGLKTNRSRHRSGTEENRNWSQEQ